jgi:hypothetical protein
MWSAMNRFGFSPTVLVLIVSLSAVTAISYLPSSQAQGATVLSVDFTGSTLPAGWFLQGSAKFIGGLNSSSGVGGIQLVNHDSQEGAVIYDSAFTTQNVIIELSGMYEPGSSSLPEADDIGVGVYSGGPSAHVGPENPASANGYYASYEFSNLGGYIGQHDLPSLMYNTHVLSSGGSLPSSGRNYLFAETIVTPTSVSLNALTRTDSPWIQEPSISLANMLTYNNVTGIDSSQSTLYVGGATFTGLLGNPWSYEYLYWLRVITYSSSISSMSSTSVSATLTQTQSVIPPITQFVTQTVTSTQPPLTQTQSVTQFATQTVTQTQSAPPPVFSLMDSTGRVIMFAVVGVVVVAVALVVVFLALRRRGPKGTARPPPIATMSPPGSVPIMSPELAGLVRHCRSCGRVLEPNARFCDGCGASQPLDYR